MHVQPSTEAHLPKLFETLSNFANAPDRDPRYKKQCSLGYFLIPLWNIFRYKVQLKMANVFKYVRCKKCGQLWHNIFAS